MYNSISKRRGRSMKLTSIITPCIPWYHVTSVALIRQFARANKGILGFRAGYFYKEYPWGPNKQVVEIGQREIFLNYVLCFTVSEMIYRWLKTTFCCILMWCFLALCSGSKTTSQNWKNNVWIQCKHSPTPSPVQQSARHDSPRKKFLPALSTTLP